MHQTKLWLRGKLHQPRSEKREPNKVRKPRIFMKDYMPSTRVFALRRFIVSCILFCACGRLSGASIPRAKGLERGIEGIPITIPRAVQYDFISRLNDRSYRLMISVPPKADSLKSYPVLYLIDGNYHFAAAANGAVYTAANQSTVPAIVVGIGYPSDDFVEIREPRVLDLTPSVNPGDEHRTGGGDMFLRVLLVRASAVA